MAKTNGSFKLGWIPGLWCLMVSVAIEAAEPAVGRSSPSPSAIDRSAVSPEALSFWIRVYTELSKEEGLLHDARHLGVVYSHLKSSGPVGRRREEVRSILLALHAKQALPDSWTPQEREVGKLFERIDEPNKFLRAAHRKRLRFQQGHRESFRAGWIEAGRYLARMEEVFRREGVPVELTRLPFVESSFNTRAYSKVGASGIFQFMPSTARRFLTLNDAVDERNDPIRAAEAAARLLKQNYESLGSWPLAVTAYNHGRLGMMNAVRKVGSEDLREIVQDYRTRGFGFASGNFYAELVASVEVDAQAKRYFGDIQRAAPDLIFEFVLPDFWRFKDLTRTFGLEPRRLRELNPSLTSEVVSGVYRVPAGYRLRIPLEGGQSPVQAEQSFASRYRQAPARYKHSEQPGKFYAKGSPQ
jgi:membrane-bound lytic murein transglycosylase D